MSQYPRRVTQAEVAAVERLFGVAGIGVEYVKNGIWEIEDGRNPEQPSSTA